MARSTPSTLLNAALGLQIAEEEAARVNVPVEKILGLRVNSPMLEVRNRVWRRLIRETGCNRAELARVWGVRRSTIGHALGLKRKRGSQPVSIYDKATLARLHSQHGYGRAADIAAGRDPATNADIAAWRRLCERAA